MTQRFYEQEYPDEGDLVMVKVIELGSLGADVELLEYGQRKAMLPFTELKHGWIRSINSYVRVGQKQILLVIDVDEERDYINVSRRRVHSADVAAFRTGYNKIRQIQGIITSVALKCKIDTQTLNTDVVWPLAKTYKTAHAGLQVAFQDPDILLDSDLSPEVKKCLMEQLKTHFAARQVKVRSLVDITCFSYEGIDAIKAALLAAIAVSPSIHASLVASPSYALEINDSNGSLEASKHMILAAIAAAEAEVKKYDGELVVREQPHAVDAFSK